MRIVNGYYNSEDGKFYSDAEFSPNKRISASQRCRYQNIPDGRMYAWNGRSFIDNAFYSDFDYVNYGDTDYIYTNRIHLALPGHRLLGQLYGVEENSVILTTKLNNTSELTFTVARIVDGEISPYYNQIIRHNELYLQGYGWFKITEEPEIENDGNVERKSVTAESGEIELQQYDLVGFSINTGDVGSREMLATDNQYEYNGYYAFHDQVRFYWDTKDLEAAITEFSHTGGTVEELKEFVETHRFLIHQKSETNPSLYTGCWRITIDPYTGAVVINAARTLTAQEKKEGVEYPDYTGLEILTMELQREKELSLLWLVLHEHGWKVGYVDPYFDDQSDVADDTVRLADKVGFFDVDSQDSYSFITQDMAQYFRCIFVFDTDNYTVNCYNINNLGYDTNIFLSFRNVQDQLTRTGREDMYTVFHVQGDDKLDFTEVNFGEDYIQDITYFLNKNHFSAEFIEKYKRWWDYRESKRAEYTQLSLDHRNKYDEVLELYNRVPVDNIEGKQYSSMNEDELFNERAGMIAIKRGIEAEFTDEEGNIDWEALKASSEWSQYQALTEVILSSPDPENTIYFMQFYEDSTRTPSYGYDFPDWYKALYPDARLGNIDIAIVNKWIIEGHYASEELPDIERIKRMNVKNQKEYLDNYAYDFDRYGHMYGVAELETQLKTLYNNISTLQTIGIDPTTGDIVDQAIYQKYEKYMNAYNSCKRALEERQAEYDEANSELEDIQNRRLEIIDDVSINNYDFGFSDEDLALLDKYYIHTDYINDNILTIKQDTNEEIIDTELKLYHDAVEQLYVESHPQYIWSTTQANLLLMPEFKRWHHELHVGNFIWVTFREDYHVKLRISELSYNPLMIDPQIKINFTSMVTYRSKRNDYTDLVSRANASTKNQISAAISKAVDNDNTINVDSALILSLINSAAFTNYLNNIDVNAGASMSDAIQTSKFSGEQITSGTVSTERLDVSGIITAGKDSVKSIISEDYVQSFITDEYIKSYINSSYVESIITEEYIQGHVDEAYLTSIISEEYIRDTVISSVSISDLTQNDIALSREMSIVSSDQTPLLTDDGITAEAIPDKVITDSKLNMVIMLDEESGEYAVVPIPQESTETFGDTLSAVINTLVERITELEDRATDFEKRISALEGGSEPEPTP